jgi:3-oxoacyl-[acyl-carrier protein] reductase
MTEPSSPPLALVTGGGRGIGKAIASRLAQDNFEVIVLDRDGAAAEACAAEISTPKIRARAAVVDLLDREATCRRCQPGSSASGPGFDRDRGAGPDRL